MLQVVVVVVGIVHALLFSARLLSQNKCEQHFYQILGQFYLHFVCMRCGISNFARISWFLVFINPLFSSKSQVKWLVFTLIDLFTRDWIRLTKSQVCKEHRSDTEILESIHFILLDTVTDMVHQCHYCFQTVVTVAAGLTALGSTSFPFYKKRVGICFKTR